MRLPSVRNYLRRLGRSLSSGAVSHYEDIEVDCAQSYKKIAQSVGKQADLLGTTASEDNVILTSFLPDIVNQVREYAEKLKY